MYQDKKEKLQQVNVNRACRQFSYSKSKVGRKDTVMCLLTFRFEYWIADLTHIMTFTEPISEIMLFFFNY